MRFELGNAQYLGTRAVQEDSFGFSDLDDREFLFHAGFVAVVADGLGGLMGGSAASSTAVRTFLAEYGKKALAETIPMALERALQRAHEAVLETADKAGARGEMGTTLAAAALHGHQLHWVSVGDSRVYLLRGGELAQASQDHVMARELDAQVARGEITESAAQRDPERDALTSFLGAAQLGSIDRSLRPFPLKDGDRVLLCSDGLHRTLLPAEIAREGSHPPPAFCEALVERLREKKLSKQDNATVLVVACAEAPEPDVVEMPEPEAASGRPRWLPLVVALLGMLVALAAGWWWSGHRTPAPGTAPAATEAPR